MHSKENIRVPRAALSAHLDKHEAVVCEIVVAKACQPRGNY
eukprot:COSAG05_NODE_19273_length_295_cov_0.744898_1_plen_40_part_10